MADNLFAKTCSHSAPRGVAGEHRVDDLVVLDELGPRVVDAELPARLEHLDGQPDERCLRPDGNGTDQPTLVTDGDR